MINRENVIKALECCYDQQSRCENCPYNDQMNCKDSAVIDALELLKVQEPTQIIRKQGKRENSDGSIEFFTEWYCPHCGMLLNRGFSTPWLEFCYKCGKKVKWE